MIHELHDMMMNAYDGERLIAYSPGVIRESAHSCPTDS